MNIGFTVAIFHWDGNLPSWTDLFKIVDSGSAIYAAAILISFVGSLSGPQALDASRWLITRNTPDEVKGMKLKVCGVYAHVIYIWRGFQDGDF